MSPKLVKKLTRKQKIEMMKLMRDEGLEVRTSYDFERKIKFPENQPDAVRNWVYRAVWYFMMMRKPEKVKFV